MSRTLSRLAIVATCAFVAIAAARAGNAHEIPSNPVASSGIQGDDLVEARQDGRREARGRKHDERREHGERQGSRSNRHDEGHHGQGRDRTR